MGLLLHMRDKVFRVKDQGVLPVPLDPDLLFLAENAHQSNIMQQIYRTQMERNRSRGPFGDAFEESEHPRSASGEFTSGGGVTKGSFKAKVDAVVDKMDFGKATAVKRGRNPKYPYVPIVDHGDRTEQIVKVAFATREEAVAFAEKSIKHRREDHRQKLHQRGNRSYRESLGLPRELPTEDAEFKEAEHPRAESGEFTSGGGTTESPKDDWHHRTNRATRHKHAEHEEAAKASREKWDAMSPVERKKWFTDHPRKARVLARKNRPPYDTPHRLMEKSNGKFVIHREDEDYGGSSNPYFFYNWRQIGDEYANRETAERHFKQRTDLDEYRKEEAEKQAAGEAKESERRAKWEAGRPQREAAEAKKQGERTKKESAMPADLQQLKSVIEKLPDEGKKGFAKSLIDRFVEKGSLTAGQQPWVKKLIDMAEHGIDKDPVIKKQADELHGIKHKLTGRDLEAAESMMEQFNARGTLSERQQSYFESLLKKARKATGDAAEFKEHEHPRKKDGKFTAKGSAEGGATSPSGTTAKAEWAEEPLGAEEITEENRPSKESVNWMEERGYKFERYDDYTDELMFRHPDGGLIAISRATENDPDTHWRYHSPIDMLWKTGASYYDLSEHLNTERRKSKAELPAELSYAPVFFKKLDYHLERYEAMHDTWVYKGPDKDTIEIRPPSKTNHQVVQWEHRTPYGEFTGEGWSKLNRHMMEYRDNPTGEAHGLSARHYQKNLKELGFKLDEESTNTATFTNTEGDVITVQHKINEKADDPEGRWTRWTLRPKDGDETDWAYGTSVGTLREAIQALPEYRKDMQKKFALKMEDITNVASDMIKSLGYKPSKLVVTADEYEFTLNGVKGKAAGTHSYDGTITLYAHQCAKMSDTTLRGVVAHEVTHEKFAQALREFREEVGEVNADQRNMDPSKSYGADWVAHPNGTIREEYAKDFPVYARLYEALGERDKLFDKLAKTDGVTAYSRDWWKAFNENTATWEQAFHETLAEMAYLETTNPAELKKVAKPWRDLYKNVVLLYNTREQRQNWKSATAQERAQWRVKEGEVTAIAASPSAAPAGEASSPTPAGGSTPHPAVTQLAHALAQVLNLGDRAFKKEDHPHAPEGAPEGKGGQFVSKGEAGGGGSTEGAKPAAKSAERAERTRLPSIKAPVTNTLLPGSAPKSHTATISSRLLTGVGATDDEYRRADLDAAKENAESFDHNTALFDNPEVYPNFKDGELDVPPDQRVRAIINHMKENLRYLYDKAPKQIREQGHEWYEGAHDLAEADAKKYGLPLQSVVGVYAALSPQNLWDMNVHQAKVVLDVYHNQQDHGWDEDMERTAKRIWKPKDQALLNTIKVPFGQLTNPAAKAMWIRTYDEAHNTDRSFNALSPDGRVIGTYKNLDGVTNKPAAWHALTPITNAILSLESGGDRTILSPAMGKQHKVRSFYNNILDPDSDNDDVTVDTHAVGAALMRPLGGTTIPVMHSFGKGPSTKAESEAINYHGTSAKGISTKGLYPIYAEAYRELAKELKIKPRVLQSITWEAKRRLFDERMTDKAKDAVELAWHDYRTGKKSHKETWDAIVKIAGGFSKGQEGASDNTSGRPTGGANEGGGRTGDARELYRSSVRGQASRTVDVRGGGHAPRGIAAGARLLWRSARLTVLLR